MARGQIHLSPSGPAPCGADAGRCPYEADGHYDSAAEAESAFAEQMGGALPPVAQSGFADASTMVLSSNFGEWEVLDGDLSDARARMALSGGLCGDLALAIHRQTGGTPYFLSFSYQSEEDLARAFAEEPNAVIAASTHVVLESPSTPGEFLDSYGRQDAESLGDSYGEDAAILRGTPEMLQHFGNSESADRLGRFAQSAIELDGRGERYAQDLDGLSWEDFEESEDEDFEDDYEEEELPSIAQPRASERGTVQLNLDFGAVAVADGDLSDPKTRHYLVNGLCGDLAMAIHEKQGGRVFFAMDEQLPPGVTLDGAAARGQLGDHVAHAFVESKESPGSFIDAYGVKSAEDIRSYYGTEIREVSPEILSRFGSGPGGTRGNHDLSGFAEAAIELDRQGKAYEYEGEN